MRHLLATMVALALAVGLLPQAAGARHGDGYSPIVPWHHQEGVTVTTGEPLEFGSRWGACTDRLAKAGRRALDVRVVVDGEELPPAGWSAPVLPSRKISATKFPKACLAKPSNRFGSWIFWRAPVTFGRPGTHRVRVTMTADQRVDDGAGEVLPAGWSISEEMTVIVEDAPPAGAFEPAGSLALARTDHTATLLSDGRVLITGGEGLEPDDLATAEVWDPGSATFSPATGLAEPVEEPPVAAEPDRLDHTATLLPDGRGLIIGGGTGSELLAEAEILDPASGAIAVAGSLADPRTGHSATFLHDGRVLVVGGTGRGGPLASAEVWAPTDKPQQCLGQRPTHFARPGVGLVGTSGNDVIAGSIGADVISGGGGNDRICGHDGDDTIDGGAGNDTIDGGPGADTLMGDGGNDRLDGHDGNDTIDGGAGNDSIDGGPGDDALMGSGGKDKLAGAAGDDTLDGGPDADICSGGAGLNWLPSCNERNTTRGTVTVRKDTKLKGPHKGRFVIGKDGVTLDCEGHTVTGAGVEVRQYGIELQGRKDVAVRNCDLREHQYAVWVEGSKRNTLSYNRASDIGDGFIINDSDQNLLQRNEVSDGSASGYVVMLGADANELIGNVAADMADHGFSFWVSTGNVISENTARDNGRSGFFAALTEQGPAVRNTFERNTAANNAGWGFEDQSDGIRGDAGTDNRYLDNDCVLNREGPSMPETICD